MSSGDEFQRYAEKAVRWARHSKPKDKAGLLYLAHMGANYVMSRDYGGSQGPKRGLQV